jgi:DNA-binding response OmpR family regulator
LWLAAAERASLCGMGLPTTAPLCLIVEDEAIIAMLLEEEVGDLGYRVSGPFASAGGALASLSGETPNVALVDYLLADGPCLGLVRELRRRNVPVAVLSGYDLRNMQNDPDWLGVEWLRKPITPKPLQATLDRFSRRSAPCLPRMASSFIAPN